MKLDEIQDIEVLRKQLKKMMCKCIKEYYLENYKGEKIKTVIGEYYRFFQDECNNYFINEKGYCSESYDSEIELYFEFPKEGDA